jgi:Flp pilus assembly protein TadD
MATIPSRDATCERKSTTWLICALLVLSVFAVYWPVVNYNFILLDDPDYVLLNPQVMQGLSWSGVTWAFTHFYVGNWHPLTWLSHMLDVQLYGLNAGGHHATNVLFHAANTVLLFLWLRRATGFVWRSALVAALFGLHPLHVESVAWVAERKDVLSTFFFLLTLMAYTRYVQKPEIRSQKSELNLPTYSSFLLAPCYWLALFCFALGLMSKPMLVTLPFVLLLLDYWPLARISTFNLQPSTFRTLLLEKAPFFVLSAGSCVLTFLAQQKGNAVMATAVLPVEDRIEHTFISYLLYLSKMLWPNSLANFYPLYLPIHEDQAIMAAFVLLLISGVIFILWRQRPYLVTGWLWYLGTLVPVIGLIQVGGQSIADRYTYLPLIGLFIAFTWLVAEISKVWPFRRLILTVLSVSVLATCGISTAKQVSYWQNSETLARHALTVTIGNAAMEKLLGDALFAQGKNEEAGQHYAEAVRLWPDAIVLRYDLARALIRQGRLDEAVDSCQAALNINPNEFKAHYLLGNIYRMQGKWSEAIAENKVALGIAPKEPLVLNNLAWLLATAPEARSRDGSEAVRLAELACQLSNYQVTAYVGTLAAAYAEAGRFDEAVTTAHKAVALATAAKNEDLIQKNQKLLELYQLKRAFHEPARQLIE